MNITDKDAPIESLDNQVIAWAREHNFLEVGACYFETEWGHTDGHSYLTFRIMHHDKGWWVIVQSEIGCVNLGTITRLEDLISVYRSLRSMEWNKSAEEGIVG